MKKKGKPAPSRRSRRRTVKRVDVAAEFARRVAAGAPTGRLYVLRLYVTGNSARSHAAVATIRAICEERLAGNYDLEVVDIYQQPAAAVGEQIVAAPTLVRQRPRPVRRMIGSLADRERVLVGLDIVKPAAAAVAGAETGAGA